jgi:hypothetical protein
MEADEAKKGMWLYSCAHYSNVLTTYMTWLKI